MPLQPQSCVRLVAVELPGARNRTLKKKKRERLMCQVCPPQDVGAINKYERSLLAAVVETHFVVVDKKASQVDFSKACLQLFRNEQRK